MESVPDLSQLTSLAGVVFLLSLAYSRLESKRHNKAIMQASRQEMTRIGEADGVVDRYKNREYYKILKGLSEGGTVSEYRSRFQSSSGWVSRLYIGLYFRNNWDRKISNAIMWTALAVIIAGNPPLIYLVRSMIIANSNATINSILVAIVSLILLFGLVISLLLILQGEHLLPSAQAVIDLCGSELEAYMTEDPPTDSSDSIGRIKSYRTD